MRMLLAGLMAAVGLHSGVLAGESLSYAPEPDWVKPQPVPGSTVDEHGPALQIRLLDTQVRYGADGRDVFTEYAVRIGSAEALAAAGNVVQVWDPQTQTVTIHHVRVLRGAQVIDALAGGRKPTVLRRESNLEASMLDGRLTATLQLEGLQVGDVVDAAVTVHDVEPVLQGRSEGIVSVAHAGEAKHVYLRESWPQSLPLRWRVGDDLPQPTLSRSGGWTAMTYDLSDTSTPPAPNGAPARYRTMGLVEVSQFSDWTQVSALMAPLYAKAAQIASGSSLQQAVARIRNTVADPQARVLAALRLVQDQVRYLFIGLNSGAYVPAPAEQTWTRRFGDCKAKTALLLAILHDLGIQAEPVLVSTTAGDGLDQRLPTLSVFDHVMVRAIIAGQTYWLDGTRLGDRTLDDSRSNNFHWVLPVRAAGAALAAFTPLDPAKPPDERRIVFDASSGFDKPVKIHAERIFRGDVAVAAHILLQVQDKTEQDRSQRQRWSQEYPWATVASVSSSFDADQRTLRLSMDGAGSVSWFEEAGFRYFSVDESNLGWNASFRRDPGPHQDAPFAVDYPSFQQAQVSVILPNGGQGSTLANGNALDETVAGVTYHRTAGIDQGRLVVAASSHSVASEFPASEAAAAQAELQRLSLHGVMIGYPIAADPAPATAAASPTGAPVTAADFAYSGANHLGETDYPAAVADFTQAMRLAPSAAKYVYDRGVAHYDAHQDDLAVADFEAALRLDRHDSFAHMALGDLHLARHQPDRARSDFDAALPNVADRAAALIRIGAAYEAQQDYADAISAYDQWLKENPAHKLRAAMLNGRCWVRAEWGRELEQALADCNASLELQPGQPNVLDSRALTELRLGQLDAAITDSSAALKARPDLAGSAYTRGLAEIRKGDVKAGSADVKAAVALRPKVAQDFARIGVPPPGR